jgi:L-ascorbate metabolism protein UlaG (beta-lactamase superfamily)
MDGETLAAIAESNPRCPFVVPAAERAKALERGIPSDRMILAKAGDDVRMTADASFSVVPSAHEERRQDGDGCDYFLGFVFKLSGKHIYHPGDCVPFEGLQLWLEPHDIELALMPVNGRDEERRSNGVPGNFHLEEAVDLCRCSGIAGMLGHHYGMFDFNTIDPELGQSKLDALVPSGEASLVKIGIRYQLE